MHGPTAVWMDTSGVAERTSSIDHGRCWLMEEQICSVMVASTSCI